MLVSGDASVKAKRGGKLWVQGKQTAQYGERDWIRFAIDFLELLN